jgi:hypothetical protein
VRLHISCHSSFWSGQFAFRLSFFSFSRMTGVAHVRHALIGSCIALVMRSRISLGMGCVSRSDVGMQSSSVVSGLGGPLVSLFAFLRLCLSFVSCSFGCLAVDVGLSICSGAIPHAAFTWLVRTVHRWRWSFSAAGCACGWGFRLGGVFLPSEQKSGRIFLQDLSCERSLPD